jgi:hypothetical protein
MTPLRRAMRLETARSWPWALILLALPATVAVWSGWVGLGSMTGFGKVHPLPGIADGFTLDTAITLPVGVEAYGAYALGVWLSHRRYSDGTRRFACVSSIGALVLGCAGQVAYHLLEVMHAAKVAHVAKDTGRAVDQVAKTMPAQAPWWIVTIVACFPVLVLGMGATLAHLTRRDLRKAAEEETAHDATTERSSTASFSQENDAVAPESAEVREGVANGYALWEALEDAPALDGGPVVTPDPLEDWYDEPARWERWPLPDLPATGGRTADQVSEDGAVRGDSDTGSGHDFSHPDGDGHGGQAPPVDLPSAVKAARAAGKSKRSIAAEFRLTRYRVDQLLDEQPQPIAAVNGHAVAE